MPTAYGIILGTMLIDINSATNIADDYSADNR
jgi:hypothetical protein